MAFWTHVRVVVMEDTPLPPRPGPPTLTRTPIPPHANPPTPTRYDGITWWLLPSAFTLSQRYLLLVSEEQTGDFSPMASMAEIREGFLCPICMKDLGSVADLQDHFEEEHAEEDKAVLKQFKGWWWDKPLHGWNICWEIFGYDQKRNFCDFCTKETFSSFVLLSLCVCFQVCLIRQSERLKFLERRYERMGQLDLQTTFQWEAAAHCLMQQHWIARHGNRRSLVRELTELQITSCIGLFSDIKKWHKNGKTTRMRYEWCALVLTTSAGIQVLCGVTLMRSKEFEMRGLTDSLWKPTSCWLDLINCSVRTPQQTQAKEKVRIWLWILNV